jgi:acyl-CoA reductase-like NAD-dependent aldehyde dehydrogenase
MVNLNESKKENWHFGVEFDSKSPEEARYSPLNDELIGSFKCGRDFEVALAVNNARDAFADWSRTTFVQRGLILRNACNLLLERSDEICSLVREETGKSLDLAKGELEAAVEFGYLMAAHGRLPIGKVLPSSVIGKEVKVTRNPIGVCGLIVSFNTPLPNYAWKVFPSLISGNTAILKPSPLTPFSAWMFAKVLKEAGVPKGVLQVIQGDGKTGELLAKSDVDLVSFTGSNQTGIAIAKETSNRTVKTILELGGSNPFIVLEDANIDLAIDFAIQSSFSNAGQRCAAGSRILLHINIAQNFIDAFKLKMNNFTYGTSTTSNMGPVISPEAANRINDFVAECEKAGADIYALGIEDGSAKSVVQPRMITNLDRHSDLAKQELFGPIVRLLTFSNDDEAVALANSTQFALTAAIWTENHSKATQLADRISAGLVNINGPTHGAEPNMPFGGFGASGNGTREAGIECLDYYSDLKIVANFITISG